MASNEIENVCSFLNTKQIRMSSSNGWLKACIEWFLSENPQYSAQEIQEFAFNQLLLADLSVVTQECLPPAVSDAHTIKLQGRYFLQVNSFFDVGQSAYRQYQNILKRDLPYEDDDDKARREDRKPWEREPKRMLKMEMTDGVLTVFGMEYSSILKLNSSTMVPGVKVLLKGPVECRSGVIMLQENNIDILGGEVDSLYEENHINRLIARKLGISEVLLALVNNDAPQVNQCLPGEEMHPVLPVPQILNNEDANVRNRSPSINYNNEDTDRPEEANAIENYFEDSDIFLNVPVDHLIENDTDRCEPTGNKVIEVNASVVGFRSPLLIKCDSWSLTVKLNTNEGSLKATLDPDLLNSLIGFSPVEIMAKESDMAVNPAIKERMDRMLKESQRAIRNLNCRMTLVQNEGIDLPVVIEISDKSAFNSE